MTRPWGYIAAHGTVCAISAAAFGWAVEWRWPWMVVFAVALAGAAWFAFAVAKRTRGPG